MHKKNGADDFGAVFMFAVKPNVQGLVHRGGSTATR